MNHISWNTIILIAIGLVSTGASGQNVYRCGSSYSQKPCPDAVVLDVDDARSKAQKAEADAKTRRETAQVTAIEKARLKEDAQQRAAQTNQAAADHKKSASNAKKSAGPSDAADVSGPRAKAGKSASKTQRMKKEPEYFVARAPADKTKPAPKR